MGGSDSFMATATQAGVDSSMTPATRAGGVGTVFLKRGAQRRMERGHPWAFSNEVEMDGAAKALAPGTPVRLATHDGTPLGVAIFNPHSLIAARRLDPSPEARIDRAWLRRRIARAEDLRRRLFEHPHYRLAHAEADGLPGVVIDRYGGLAAARIATAGMERLADEIAAALMEETGVETVVLRGGGTARRLEGLGEDDRIVGARPEGATWVLENGLRYRADPLAGQKTGWFFDQRENRAFMARLAGGASVLDVYCYGGGFGLACAAGGAGRVTMVDRSEAALALAGEAAAAGGFGGRVTMAAGDAFADLVRRRDRGERFDIVICDPPAFVRSRKQLGAGSRAYRKLARLAARLVAPGGLLALASCSHHVDRAGFVEQLRRGLDDAGREGAIIREAGAGPDHPIHPHLPESAYLKFVCLRLDGGGG